MTIQIIDAGVDEDSLVVISAATDVTKYKYRGYINSEANAMIIDSSDLEQEIETIMDMTHDEEFFFDTEKNIELLKQQFDLIKRLVQTDEDCLLIGWAMEYDSSICVLFGESKIELTNWFNREVDDSEFDQL